MRKAAGVMMIILGAIALGIDVYLSWLYAGRIVPLGIFMFAWAIFVLIGGILCLMRKYWGVCLASTIAAVVLGLFGFPVVLGLWAYLIGQFLGIAGSPVVIAGGIVSIVFISRRKKEWQEILA